MNQKKFQKNPGEVENYQRNIPFHFKEKNVFVNLFLQFWRYEAVLYTLDGSHGYLLLLLSLLHKWASSKLKSKSVAHHSSERPVQVGYLEIFRQNL